MSLFIFGKKNLAMQRASEQGRKQNQAYMIPSMDVNEIAHYLADIGFQINALDIQKPSPQYVQKLYEGVLEVFTDEKIEDVLRLQGDMQGAEESLAIAVTYRRMKAFLERIGVASFQMRDVISPERSRLVWILTCIVNFSFFRDSKRPVCERMAQKRIEIEGALEDCALEIQRAEEARSLRLAKKQADKEAIRSLNKEIASKEADLIKCHRKQQALVNEIEDLRREYNVHTDKVGSEKYRLISIKQELTRLRARIVSNPEQLRELLLQMKGQQVSEEGVNREYEKRSAALDRKSAEFRAHAEKMKSVIYVVSMANEYRRKHEGLTSEVHRYATLNSALSIENESDASKKNLLDKKIHYISNKIDALHASEAERTSKLKAQLEAFKSQHAQISEEKDSVLSAVLENNTLVKDMECGMLNLKTTHDAEASALSSELIELRGIFTNYTDDLRSALHAFL